MIKQYGECVCVCCSLRQYVLQYSVRDVTVGEGFPVPMGRQITLRIGTINSKYKTFFYMIFILIFLTIIILYFAVLHGVQTVIILHLIIVQVIDAIIVSFIIVMILAIIVFCSINK